MSRKDKKNPKAKSELHPRNRHRGRYDFKELIKSCKSLASFVSPNKYGDLSIDFSDPEAVKMLNKALLKHFYGIDFWEIPDNYLCPPIPGRADYIHHIADLLANDNEGEIPTGKRIKCLDIGVGANCVYPIIGNKEYGWSFVGSDVDKISIASANKIVERNSRLKKSVECRLQENPKHIFNGIIKKGEFYNATFCNPPFYSSAAEAKSGNLRKLSNLNNKKITKSKRNFGGQNREIWCDGGEAKFVENIIRESLQFKNSSFWFSTLVSKQSNLRKIYSALRNADVFEVKTIQMEQGNKISRIIAWTFFDEKQRKYPTKQNGEV